MVLPKAPVPTEDLVTAVNQTLGVFYYNMQFRDYSFFYDLYHKIYKKRVNIYETSVVIHSEKIILCEIHAGLWEKALITGISSLTAQTCPHYKVVEEFINCLLNSHPSEDFGLLEDFFWKLILTHPPKLKMFDYYLAILNDHFINVTGKNKEEENILVWLLETLTICLENVDKVNEETLTQKHRSEVTHILTQRASQIDSFARINKGNIIYFKDLSWNEKTKRCLIALNFVYNIFETDFAFRLHGNVLKCGLEKSESRALLAHVMWKEASDTGLINKNCNKLLDVYSSMLRAKKFNVPEYNVVNKLVSLLGETIRFDGNLERIKYPFYEAKLYNLTHELSSIILKYIQLCKISGYSADQLLVSIKPAWFRALVCSHLLSHFTGYQCLPELTSACDILKQLLHQNTKPQRKKPRKVKTLSKFGAKHKELKNLNRESLNGSLHKVCESNDVQKIKTLLQYAEIDVNAIDSKGRTPLHIAAHKGHFNCVEELLRFSPNISQKPLFTRFRGPDGMTPLMSATKEGHVDVCRLLLEHTGSILLDDVNDFNETAFDLSKDQEVTNILQHYKDNIACTKHSQGNIKVQPELKEVVFRLSLEMIKAYFCTHRTLDVYETLVKDQKNSSSESFSKIDFKWDYSRYQRDIKSSIHELKKLVSTLKNVPELETSYEWYTRILSINRS